MPLKKLMFAKVSGNIIWHYMIFSFAALPKGNIKLIEFLITNFDLEIIFFSSERSISSCKVKERRLCVNFKDLPHRQDN